MPPSPAALLPEAPGGEAHADKTQRQRAPTGQAVQAGSLGRPMRGQGPHSTCRVGAGTHEGTGELAPGLLLVGHPPSKSSSTASAHTHTPSGSPRKMVPIQPCAPREGWSQHYQQGCSGAQGPPHPMQNQREKKLTQTQTWRKLSQRKEERLERREGSEGQKGGRGGGKAAAPPEGPSTTQKPVGDKSLVLNDLQFAQS